ncbi:hypothetical protein GGI05_004381, partial [Coemansia sp. RSA 2603]
MDCDYDVHSTLKSAYKSTDIEADRQFAGEKRRRYLQHMDIPHTTQYSSHSAAVSSSCSSSGPPTNCSSPMALLRSALLAPHDAASVSNNPATTIKATDNHTINLASCGPVSRVTKPQSEPVALSSTSPVSVANDAPAFGQPHYPRSPTQLDIPDVSNVSAAQTSAPQPFPLVPLTNPGIASVSALTINVLSEDINMDSESEADEVLSPVQRAQRVAGTHSTSQQLSPPSPRSRSQSQSQSQNQQRPDYHVSPIRSLTEALALSPRGTADPQQYQIPRQQRNTADIGIRSGRGQSSRSGSGNSGDDIMAAGDSNSGNDSTEMILQNVLARVSQVYRCCERVLQLQQRTSLRIEHLEVAVEKINQNLAPSSTTAAAAALAENITGTGSHAESAFQADQSFVTLAVSEDANTDQDRSPMHQGRDRYASPSPGYMSPAGESRGHAFMHQLSTSAPAGLQSSPRSATSSVYRHTHQRLHVRSTPYSERTSPTTPVTARSQMFGTGSLTSSTLTTGQKTGGDGSLAYSPPQMLQAQNQLHYHQQQQQHQQHRRHRGSISRFSPPNYRVYRQDSGGQAQQELVQQQQQQQRSVAGSSWPPHQLRMQQPSLLLSHPVSTLPSNPATAFGQGVQGATDTAGSMHPQTYSARQQRQMQDMAGYPSTGIKRQRVGDEPSLSGHTSSGRPATDTAFRPLPFTASPSQQQQHQHSSQFHYQLQRTHSHPHAMLPPIRVGIGAVGISPGASGLASGSDSTSSARMHGLRGTFKGKAAATTGDIRKMGNPEAKPTNAWLTSQRHYKLGLQRLMTLDSFYPSDTAMLQVFRQHDDFTPEQIEQHGAALLSWARGWLRYNRNAVLRHMLLNKGT